MHHAAVHGSDAPARLTPLALVSQAISYTCLLTLPCVKQTGMVWTGAPCAYRNSCSLMVLILLDFST